MSIIPNKNELFFQKEDNVPQFIIKYEYPYIAIFKTDVQIIKIDGIYHIYPTKYYDDALISLFVDSTFYPLFDKNSRWEPTVIDYSKLQTYQYPNGCRENYMEYKALKINNCIILNLHCPERIINI